MIRKLFSLNMIFVLSLLSLEQDELNDAGESRHHDVSDLFDDRVLG